MMRVLRALDEVLRSAWSRAVIGVALVFEGILVSNVPGREIPGLLIALFGLWLMFGALREVG